MKVEWALSRRSRLLTIRQVGRWVAGVVVCALAIPASADTPVAPRPGATPENADAPPPVHVRPVRPEDSWYAALAPATITSTPPSRRGVARGGLVALAGLTQTIDATMGRVDIGVPTPTSQFQRLRTLIISEVGTGTDGAAEARDLVLTPELQYDWRLPFTLAGDVVLVLGAGLQWARHWVRLPDEPYWPSSWESTTSWGARLDTAIQYRRPGGLVVSLNLLSVTFPLNTPTPPDSRWMSSDPDMRYSVSILAGYQFE